MKNGVKIILIALVIGAVFGVYKLVSSKGDISTSNAGVGISVPAGIPQSYVQSMVKISPELVSYLKSSATYGTYYKANKKFAVYHTGITIPIAVAFTNAASSIAQNSSFKKNYNFLAIDSTKSRSFSSKKEAEEEMAFTNTCHEFCIVNPSKNELFFIKGLSADGGSKLPTVFADLKSW